MSQLPGTSMHHAIIWTLDKDKAIPNLKLSLQYTTLFDVNLKCIAFLNSVMQLFNILSGWNFAFAEFNKARLTSG